jgi:ubiquinone/menaquinone biosynthesis C-methylase UbiE
VLSRAERHPGRGSRSAAEVEDVNVSAPALVH